MRVTAVFAVSLVSFFTATSARAAKPAARAAGAGCDGKGDGAGVQIWVAPLAPTADRPLKVLAVSEEDRGAADVVLTGPDGKPAPLRTVRRGGPPFGFEAVLPAPASGRYAVALVRDGKQLGCRTVEVAARGRRPPPRPLPPVGVWPSARAWDRTTESFYSAWIESLFDAPPGESLGFRPLAQALRDPARNFLYDYLGLGEDTPRAPEKGKAGKGGKETALAAAPDCADLPYFSRAYFSWKIGLPFGFRDCDRGAEGRPPRCQELITNETPLATLAQGKDAPTEPLGAMKKFLRVLANKVHSGSARTGLADDQTDYYPVPLTREALRPGAVYADPYGHVLMLVKWVDQGGDAGGAGAGGMLLAVDGQPDGSVGRKRFWEGTFLFASGVVTAGPGWKAFRPLVRDGGALVPLTNAALKNDKRFAPFSLEQKDLAPEAFYARVGKLINPRGLEPAAAYGETLNALVEQLETRIGSVDNGEKYMRESKAALVPMPEGSKIFETVGAWEDYATPSRDMRLLIAIDVLETLPDRIVRHPELFNLGDRKPDAARVEVQALHAARIKERGIEYRKSDGTAFKLTVADVLGRKTGFEMSYNPNDCVEIRWAAPEGSPEATSCKRHAPDDQRARMAEYRPWFHDRRRPPR